MGLLTISTFEPVFEPLVGQRVGYLPVSGTPGDRLVELATLQAFALHGIEFHIETLADPCAAEVLVLPGGGPGPLCAAGLEGRLADLASSRPVVLLPRALTGPTGLRLRRSYVSDGVSRTFEPKAVLMPPLVLGLDIAPPVAADDDLGVWLRHDSEARWGGAGLGDPELMCGTAAEYLALAARCRRVVTDRATFAVAALVQRRDVTLLPSTTGHNRSLYDTWLGALGCHWADDVADAVSALGRASTTVAVGVPFEPAAPPQDTAVRADDFHEATLRLAQDRLSTVASPVDASLAVILATQLDLATRLDAIQASLTRPSAAPPHDSVPVPAEPSTASPAAEEASRAYQALLGRLREVARVSLPTDARVLVISRGDDSLLDLAGRVAGHFPQDENGVPLWHHPQDAGEAVRLLDALSTKGWTHLLVPATAFWWLEHYAGFAAHLRRTASVVHRDADTLLVTLRCERPWTTLTAFVDAFRRAEGRHPAILDWGTGADLAGVFPEVPVFEPPDVEADTLVYVDESIDIIAVPAYKAGRLPEAARVATAAVVTLTLNASTGEPSAVLVRAPGDCTDEGRAPAPTHDGQVKAW